LSRRTDLAAIRAFAGGRFAAWRGLPEGADRALVTQALGQPLAEEDAPRRLGTWAGGSRSYPGRVEAWFDGDFVILLQVDWPPLERPLEEALGPPEAVAPSLLGSGREQLIWASRGLAAHRSTVDGGVATVFGFTPTTVEDFLQGALASIESHRRRV
jgi:hypothetical protein